MNTVNPTRVALIGCGAIATTQHLPAYEAAASAGLCRLVGVCDLDAERARSAASHFGVPAFESQGDAAQSDEVHFDPGGGALLR